MKSRVQKIAKFCWEEINTLKSVSYKKQLRQYAKNSGPMILSNGLIETLIFYSEKAKVKDEDKKSNEKLAYEKLEEIITVFWKKFILTGDSTKAGNGSDLKSALINEYSSTEVLVITDRILNMLTMLKRIASAEIED